MSKIKLISLFSICLLAVGLVYYFFFKETSRTFPEEVTKNLVIKFEKIDSEIESIYCTVLSHPIKNFAEITSSESQMILPQGVNKTFFCDGIIDNKSFPIFWTLPFNNLDQLASQSRGFFSTQEELVINKVFYHQRDNVAYATISSPNLPKFTDRVTLKGEYKIKSLKSNTFASSKIKDEIPLCNLCSETPRNNGVFYINQIPINDEFNMSSTLGNLWDSESSAKKCNYLFGLTTKDLLDRKIPIKYDDPLLKTFEWDSSLEDGWRSSEATALVDINGCSYNAATTEWVCEKDENNLPKIYIKKGDKCSSTSSVKHRESCEVMYFGTNIYPDGTNRCMNMKFVNFGGNSATIEPNHPTARGLMFTQRSLLLDKNIWSSHFSMEIVKPFSHKNRLIPCKVKFETSSITKQLNDKELLIFQEKRFVNIDFNPACVDSTKDLISVKSIYLGEKQ